LELGPSPGPTCEKNVKIQKWVKKVKKTQKSDNFQKNFIVQYKRGIENDNLCFFDKNR